MYAYQIKTDVLHIGNVPKLCLKALFHNPPEMLSQVLLGKHAPLGVIPRKTFSRLSLNVAAASQSITLSGVEGSPLAIAIAVHEHRYL